MKVVQIPRTLYQAIFAAADEAKPRETGGVLMGTHTEGGKSSQVTELVSGGPNAIATPSSFDPDQEFQQAAVDRLFLEHCGSLNYLGDWHSHPRGDPYPSQTDRKALRSIRASADARCPEPIMLICGGHVEIMLRAFQLTANGREVEELSLELID
jgi:integrative and conjugative element protein (TIGR02256 family)